MKNRTISLAEAGAKTAEICHKRDVSEELQKTGIEDFMTLQLSCNHKKQAVKALDGLNGTNPSHQVLSETLNNEFSSIYAVK